MKCMWSLCEEGNWDDKGSELSRCGGGVRFRRLRRDGRRSHAEGGGACPGSAQYDGDRPGDGAEGEGGDPRRDGGVPLKAASRDSSGEPLLLAFTACEQPEQPSGLPVW